MPREYGQMMITSLKRLIHDEAGFHTSESTIAVTVFALVAVLGIATLGGSAADFLATAGEEVKSSTILMPSFGQNPLSN
jgi:Flp pilus assembly pilin Flp